MKWEHVFVNSLASKRTPSFFSSPLYFHAEFTETVFYELPIT